MRNPPRQPTNSLYRKAYNQHSTLPPEFDQVKQYLTHHLQLAGFAPVSGTIAVVLGQCTRGW